MAKTKYLTKALRCPDGTRKYIRGKTQAELDRKVREAQALLGMGININDNTTVAEYAQTWIDVYKRPHVKPQTLELILNVLNTHILPYIGAMRVRDVRTADCARIMAKAGDRGLAKSTQNHVRSRMKEMFACAVEDRVIPENPVTKSVKVNGYESQPREPLTSAQMDTLMKGALELGDRSLLTFILLCGYAGLRAAEALGLNLKNVDLDRGTVKVVEQYRTYHLSAGTTTDLKTSASRREIPMAPMLMAHMTELKRERNEGYIFDITDRSLDKKYSQMLSGLSDVKPNGEQKQRWQRHQAPVGTYVHPHLLRHTFCTRCFEAGMDIKEVQYLMGHTTPTLTVKTYAHYQAGARREETSQKLSRAFPATAIAVIG